LSSTTFDGAGLPAATSSTGGAAARKSVSTTRKTSPTTNWPGKVAPRLFKVGSLSNGPGERKDRMMYTLIAIAVLALAGGAIMPRRPVWWLSLTVGLLAAALGTMHITERYTPPIWPTQLVWVLLGCTCGLIGYGLRGFIDRRRA
jgi:hypothetical protein